MASLLTGNHFVIIKVCVSVVQIKTYREGSAKIDDDGWDAFINLLRECIVNHGSVRPSRSFRTFWS